MLVPSSMRVGEGLAEKNTKQQMAGGEAGRRKLAAQLPELAQRALVLRTARLAPQLVRWSPNFEKFRIIDKLFLCNC